MTAERSSNPPKTPSAQNVTALRSAVAQDAGVVLALAQQAFAPYTAAIGRPAAPVHYDYGALIATGRMRLAVLNDEVVGLCYTVPQEDGTVMLDVLAVAEAAQGRGVARVLVQDAEHMARAMGGSALVLYTNVVMDSALATYPRLGFHETHRGATDGFQRVHFRKEL